MRVTLFVIGKPSPEYSPVIRDYEKRLHKYCRFEVFELKNEKSLKLNDCFYVLDSKGLEFSSESLAEWLKSKESVIFVIGGDTGLSESIKTRAKQKISLSKMTFPHQMARLILTEQIYRAFTILKGEKYHK